MLRIMKQCIKSTASTDEKSIGKKQQNLTAAEAYTTILFEIDKAR